MLNRNWVAREIGDARMDERKERNHCKYFARARARRLGQKVENRVREVGMLLKGHSKERSFSVYSSLVMSEVAQLYNTRQFAGFNIHRVVGLLLAAELRRTMKF